MIYRLVFDATAVAAFAAESIHVGEILAEVTDEWSGDDGPQVAVPLPALAEAARTGVGMGALDRLVGIKPVRVTVPDPNDWRRIANGADLLGGLDRACAALDQAQGRAEMILTADPDAYGGLDTIAI